jgi:hypothetical protein
VIGSGAYGSIPVTGGLISQRAICPEFRRANHCAIVCKKLRSFFRPVSMPFLAANYKPFFGSYLQYHHLDIPGDATTCTPNGVEGGDNNRLIPLHRIAAGSVNRDNPGRANSYQSYRSYESYSCHAPSLLPQSHRDQPERQTRVRVPTPNPERQTSSLCWPGEYDINFSVRIISMRRNLATLPTSKEGSRAPLGSAAVL